MLKVEWGMLNSHSSSFSLAGGRRACPALKPDAADQVLLKNRAGFAAFSKGRAFHHVGNRIAARVTGRRGPAGQAPRTRDKNGWRCRYHKTKIVTAPPVVSTLCGAFAMIFSDTLEIHRAVAVEAGEGEVVAIEEIEVVEARLCVEIYLLQVVDYVEFAAVIGFGQQPEV